MAVLIASLPVTGDERALADVARSAAAAADLRAATRALHDAGTVSGLPACWARMVELGWTGLHLPESAGGQGGRLADLAVVVEQVGAALAPGPFLPAVIGSAVLARCATGSDGSDGSEGSAAAELLPGCADGSLIAAFGVGEGVTHVADGDGSATLAGSLSVVGGVWAGHLLVATGEDVVLVDVTADGVTLDPADGAADPSLGLARVQLDGTTGHRFAGQAAAALALARTLAAAEAAGGARATLQSALEYAKVREQFGRPIGSFQAIKHHLANMRIANEQAVAVAWDAARAAGRTDGQGELAAAVAAAVALPAYQRNAQLNIQVHGGIGFTWEHDAHLYLRRAITLAAAYGSPDTAAVQTAALTAAGVRRTVAVDLPSEAEQFRAAARAFAERFTAAAEDDRRALLVDSGYLVPHWPAPFGRGAGSVEQLVLEQEFAGLDIPSLGIGGWVLMTLMQQGTPEQVERWIRPGLLGEQIWCQLFSEPNAGSDAAAVQTRAVRDDEQGGWRISGQKVWTSGAQYCHRGLATVRTDPRAAKHRGITAVVVDLHAPGVEVRPLREISGGTRFNEVFFDDVFVPDEDVVGAVNDGWTVARATLGNERVSIGGGSYLGGRAAALVPQVRDAAAGLQREVGALIAVEQSVQLINLRVVARSVAGGEPGAEGSITKLLTAEHLQHVTELALRLAGPAAVDGSAAAITTDYLLNRSMTIAGGTSEVSRNVIAERLLGLPREAIAN